jgi:hypothetical protein
MLTRRPGEQGVRGGADDLVRQFDLVAFDRPGACTSSVLLLAAGRWSGVDRG